MSRLICSLQQAPRPTKHLTGYCFFLCILYPCPEIPCLAIQIALKPRCLVWWLCPPDCNSDICLQPGLNSISMAIWELISMVALLNFISGQQSAANIVFPRILEFQFQNCDKGRVSWPFGKMHWEHGQTSTSDKSIHTYVFLPLQYSQWLLATQCHFILKTPYKFCSYICIYAYICGCKYTL